MLYKKNKYLVSLTLSRLIRMTDLKKKLLIYQSLTSEFGLFFFKMRIILVTLYLILWNPWLVSVECERNTIQSQWEEKVKEEAVSCRTKEQCEFVPDSRSLVSTLCELGASVTPLLRPRLCDVLVILQSDYKGLNHNHPSNCPTLWNTFNLEGS